MAEHPQPLRGLKRRASDASMIEFDVPPPKRTKSTLDCSASSGEQQPENGLLYLPAELRNKIYDIALTHNTEIPRRTPGPIHPLLHVCKQIRSEAEPMFWARVTLYGDVGTLGHEIRRLTDVAKRNLKAVLIETCSFSIPPTVYAAYAFGACRQCLQAAGLRSPNAVMQIRVVDKDRVNGFVGYDRSYVLEEPFYKQKV